MLERRKYLESGRLFGPSAGASAVIDYIVTRHGHMAMHGADYLAALKPEQRTEILKKNRALPYGSSHILFPVFPDCFPQVTTGNGLQIPAPDLPGCSLQVPVRMPLVLLPFLRMLRSRLPHPTQPEGSFGQITVLK